MLGQLGKLFGRGSKSAGTAKSRLQLVLARERVGLPETTLNSLREDLMEVISKYFEIEDGSLEIEIMPADGKSALTVNTSVTKSKAS